jgi:hypothetical protein
VARIKYWNETSQAWEYADKALKIDNNLLIDKTLTIEGKAADAKAVGDAIASIELSNDIYVQNEEPIDAPDGAVWIDTDEEEKTEADLIATDEDVLEFVMEMGYANPLVNDSNGVYTDNYNNVYVL